MSVECPHCERVFDSPRAKSVHVSQVHNGGHPSTRCNRYGHRVIDTKHDNERYRVQLHRLHATLLIDKISELDGMEIHHKNGCPFDNRLGNYEIIDEDIHRKKSKSVYRKLFGFKILCRTCGDHTQINSQDNVSYCPRCGSQLSNEEIVRSEPINWYIKH